MICKQLLTSQTQACCRLLQFNLSHEHYHLNTVNFDPEQICLWSLAKQIQEKRDL